MQTTFDRLRILTGIMTILLLRMRALATAVSYYVENALFLLSYLQKRGINKSYRQG